MDSPSINAAATPINDAETPQEPQISYQKETEIDFEEFEITAPPETPYLPLTTGLRFQCDEYLPIESRKELARYRRCLSGDWVKPEEPLKSVEFDITGYGPATQSSGLLKGTSLTETGLGGGINVDHVMIEDPSDPESSPITNIFEANSSVVESAVFANHGWQQKTVADFRLKAGSFAVFSAREDSGYYGGVTGSMEGQFGAGGIFAWRDLDERGTGGLKLDLTGEFGWRQKTGSIASAVSPTVGYSPLWIADTTDESGFLVPRFSGGAQGRLIVNDKAYFSAEAKCYPHAGILLQENRNWTGLVLRHSLMWKFNDRWALSGAGAYARFESRDSRDELRQDWKATLSMVRNLSE